MVSCTVKGDMAGQDYQVRAISGQKDDGACWKLSQEDAITEIEAGVSKFQVDINGFICEVVVAVNNGRKYLKTHIDQDMPIILLALPDC